MDTRNTFSGASMAMWGIAFALMGMALLAVLVPQGDPFLAGFVGGFALGCALYTGWFAFKQNRNVDHTGE